MKRGETKPGSYIKVPNTEGPTRTRAMRQRHIFFTDQKYQKPGHEGEERRRK